MRGRLSAALVAIGLTMAAACGNSGDDAGSGDDGDGERVTVDQPGVTDDAIRVGGFASVTNVLNGPYGSAFDGVDAYFRRVNEEGGVHGRRLELVARHDDAMVNSQQKINELLTRDNVFAVLPVATLVFNGVQRLVDERVPTFGWNISADWGLGDNLYGDKGSYLCVDCRDTFQVASWVANEIGAGKMGVMAYSVAQSKGCGEGMVKQLEQMGNTPELGFQDLSLDFGVRDLSVQVKAMKDAGVDFVGTCIDQNGVVTLANEMRKQGLDVPLLLPNAYDHAFLDKYGDALEGSYVLVTFTPFEVPDDEKPEGLVRFEEAMRDAGKEDSINEIGLSGWLNADLFVRGLEAAGPDFSREKVIDAINQITDYTADGILPAIDWSMKRQQLPPYVCTALLEVVDGGELELRFSQPGKPFVCFRSGASAIPDEPSLRK